jgi:hypothetical protein
MLTRQNIPVNKQIRHNFPIFASLPTRWQFGGLVAAKWSPASTPVGRQLSKLCLNMNNSNEL